MDKQEELNKELDRCTEFFEGNKKNDLCYWRLYTSKYSNSKCDQKNLKATNFESEDLEESIEMLKQQFILHGRYSPRFWIVKLMSSSTDPNGITIILKNVLSEEVKREESAINGFGYQESSSMQNLMLQMQKEMFEKTSSLEKLLNEERHNRELERMQERLEALESSSKTVIDSITGFAESETGKTVISGIMAIITQKLNTPNMAFNPAQKQHIQMQQPVQQAAPKTNQPEQPEMQSFESEKIKESLEELKKMFGDDMPEILMGVANFCKNNPAYAQQIKAQATQATAG